MFMGKVDVKNTIQLLKIRNKDNYVAKKICIFLTALFGLDVIGLLKGTLTYSEEIASISPQIYSTWGFILVIFTCIIYTADYKNKNYTYQIFPQNNISRFISYELSCYITFLTVQIYTLFLYLLQYGVTLIMDFLTNNIEFVYHFSIQYIIIGFFVTMMYGFLAISIVILMGTMDRKSQYIFRGLAIAIFVSWIIMKNRFVLNRLIEFYTKEPSIILFLAKSICTWIGIVSLYHILNKYTKYYSTEKKTSYAYMLIAGIIPFILLIFIYSPVTTSKVESINLTENSLDWKNITKYTGHYVDVSNIPDGTELKIVLSEENKKDFNINYLEMSNRSYKDKIEVDFNPNYRMTNDIDFNKYEKPDLEVKLENNTIYFHVKIKENIKVIFSSPYSVMPQFDYFKGKQIYKEFYGSKGGSGSGTINIYLPKNKKLYLRDVEINN